LPAKGVKAWVFEGWFLWLLYDDYPGKHEGGFRDFSVAFAQVIGPGKVLSMIIEQQK